MQAGDQSQASGSTSERTRVSAKRLHVQLVCCPPRSCQFNFTQLLRKPGSTCLMLGTQSQTRDGQRDAQASGGPSGIRQGLLLNPMLQLPTSPPGQGRPQWLAGTPTQKSTFRSSRSVRHKGQCHQRQCPRRPPRPGNMDLSPPFRHSILPEDRYTCWGPKATSEPPIRAPAWMLHHQPLLTARHTWREHAERRAGKPRPPSFLHGRVRAGQREGSLC